MFGVSASYPVVIFARVLIMSLDPGAARVGALELELAAQVRRVADLERALVQQRHANTVLRGVIHDKDGELARRDVELKQQAAGLEALRLQVADLARRLGQSSQNSSVPPSKDRPGQKKPKRGRRADAANGDGSPQKRKRGGQPGHRGSGLRPASGDELAGRVKAPPPQACGGCGNELADAADAGDRWAQVWDIPPVRLDKWQWVLPRRRCGCGTVTCAQVPQVPWATPGTVVYGPNVNAATVLISNYGTVPVERCADMMGMLLGTPVSTGFVSQSNSRLAAALAGGGYDEAVKAELIRAGVLAADETPVNLIAGNTDADGQPQPGSPYILTVLAPGGLMWLTALGSRSKQALAAAGILSGFRGVLVRDDYAGYRQFDSHLAGVQLCNAHLAREAQGVADLDPATQDWAERIITILTQANTARDDAIAADATSLDPDLLAKLRTAYDTAVADGLAINTDRPWHDGNHPGWRLAKRLQDRADQVWTFTTRFDVPFTSNSAEQALRMGKVRQKISGCWHTLATLGDWCRIRSYLVNTRREGIRPIDAIHTALADNPWLPAHDTS